MVGSWPRSPELLRAQKLKRGGKLSAADFEKTADAEIASLISLLNEIDVDIVTDGELRRDNFYSFVAEKLSGTKLMTLAEMLEVVEDKSGFERLLQSLDVPAFSLSNPCCVGRIERRKPLAVDELKFARQHTDRPIKIPLPGPYLLTRAMFVKELTRETYPHKEALAEDIVNVLREEIADLIAAGADFIQFDEPVLTEVAFNPAGTRTFMCASLAERGDPEQELEFATSLINRVTAGFTKTDGNAHAPIFGVHVCRGNWSQNEAILLSGNYSPLANYLERLNVDQLVLEYATDRAGELMRFGQKQLGLGVVNPRIEAIEPLDEILSSINRAREYFADDQIFLNPDCGFGTFSNSPVNCESIALGKMRAIVAAAKTLRQNNGRPVSARPTKSCK